jgi:hypothetical protein
MRTSIKGTSFDRFGISEKRSRRQRDMRRIDFASPKVHIKLSVTCRTVSWVTAKFTTLSESRNDMTKPRPKDNQTFGSRYHFRKYADVMSKIFFILFNAVFLIFFLSFF